MGANPSFLWRETKVCPKESEGGNDSICENSEVAYNSSEFLLPSYHIPDPPLCPSWALAWLLSILLLYLPIKDDDTIFLKKFGTFTLKKLYLTAFEGFLYVKNCFKCFMCSRMFTKKSIPSFRHRKLKTREFLITKN